LHSNSANGGGGPGGGPGGLRLAFGSSLYKKFIKVFDLFS
jgi:hypothetical protein